MILRPRAEGELYRITTLLPPSETSAEAAGLGIAGARVLEVIVDRAAVGPRGVGRRPDELDAVGCTGEAECEREDNEDETGAQWATRGDGRHEAGHHGASFSTRTLQSAPQAMPWAFTKSP